MVSQSEDGSSGFGLSREHSQSIGSMDDGVRRDTLGRRLSERPYSASEGSSIERRETVYNKEAIERVIMDYTLACHGEPEDAHPNPNGILKIIVQRFLTEEVSNYHCVPSSSLTQEHFVTLELYSDGVAYQYMNDYDRDVSFLDNHDLLRRFVASAAIEVQTDMARLLLPKALTQDLLAVQATYEARRVSSHLGVNGSQRLPIEARRVSSSLTGADGNSVKVVPKRSSSEPVLRSRADDEPMTRTKTKSKFKVRGRKKATRRKPVITEQGTIVLKADDYEVEARWSDPSLVYDTGAEVGKGGFGAVCIVKRKEDGQGFVMKYSDMAVPRPGKDCKGKDEVREIWTMSRTLHPNLIHLHDPILWEHPDPVKSNDSKLVLCLIMDAVSPPTNWEISHPSLTLHIGEGASRLSETLACLVVKQVADGLEHLNEKLDTVHRDLKADNVLIGRGGFHNIKVCDYGTCIRLDRVQQPDGSSLLQKQVRACVGTTTYRAPELWDAIITGNGSETGAGYEATALTTSKVDVWSLGCILYFMLSQTPCYVEGVTIDSDGDKKEFQHRIKDGDVDLSSPNWASPPPVGVSEGAKEFLMKLLTRNVEDRISLKEISEDEWFRYQLKGLNNCYMLQDKDTQLFDVSLQRAVERSDKTGDLIPAPIVEILRWLRTSPKEAERREQVYEIVVSGKMPHSRISHSRAQRYQLLFDTDSEFQIPVDETADVVLNVLNIFINLIENEEGKGVSILGGTLQADNKLSISFRGLTEAEARSKARAVLEELEPRNMALLEVLIEYWHEELLEYQRKDEASGSSQGINWAYYIINRHCSLLKDFLTVIIQDPTLCEGLTPRSHRGQVERTKSQAEAKLASEKANRTKPDSPSLAASIAPYDVRAQALMEAFGNDVLTDDNPDNDWIRSSLLREEKSAASIAPITIEEALRTANLDGDVRTDENLTLTVTDTLTDENPDNDWIRASSPRHKLRIQKSGRLSPGSSSMGEQNVLVRVPAFHPEPVNIRSEDCLTDEEEDGPLSPLMESIGDEVEEEEEEESGGVEYTQKVSVSRVRGFWGKTASERESVVTRSPSEVRRTTNVMASKWANRKPSFTSKSTQSPVLRKSASGSAPNSFRFSASQSDRTSRQEKREEVKKVKKEEREIMKKVIDASHGESGIRIEPKILRSYSYIKLKKFMKAQGFTDAQLNPCRDVNAELRLLEREMPHLFLDQ